jgi:recombination protein RecT
MNALTVIEEFHGELVARQDELSRILPPHINRDRFLQTAIIAFQDNPDLALADRQSVHKALTKAAEDGLHPDGREGTITIFSAKVKRNGKEVWIKQAQWSPMTWGIRKRARELCSMVIDAQVVYAADKFIWRQGDHPSIDHEPAKLGTDRGKPVGSYAIFRIGDDVLHREVMSEAEIIKVKEQSKNPGGLMWTKFWSEGWKKSAVRRGIKTVPSVPALERIIARVDEDYPQFGPSPADSKSNVVPLATYDQQARAIPVEVVAEAVPEPEIADDPDTPRLAPVSAPPAAKQQTAAATLAATKSTPLAGFERAAAAAATAEALNGIWSMFEAKLPPADHEAAVAMFEAAFNRISKGA